MRRHETDIKFGVFKFKRIKERFESFRMRNITFLLQIFERKIENVKIFFIKEDKNSNKVNFFRFRRLQISLRIEEFLKDLLEILLETKIFLAGN